MTRNEAVALIKQRMGNNTDSSLDAHIVTEMQLAQSTLEQEHELPWFLVEEGETNVAASTRTFTPTATDSRAFLAPFPDVPFYVYKATETLADKKALQPDDYKVLWNSYSATADADPPRAYANDLSVLNSYALFPKPLSDSVVVVPGYYADAVLSTDITNKWLTYAPEILLNLTGKVISGFYTAFMQFAASFEKRELEARRALKLKNVVWEENYVRRMMGDS